MEIQTKEMCNICAKIKTVAYFTTKIFRDAKHSNFNIEDGLVTHICINCAAEIVELLKNK
jgi:hypothetical protein